MDSDMIEHDVQALEGAVEILATRVKAIEDWLDGTREPITAVVEGGDPHDFCPCCGEPGLQSDLGRYARVCSTVLCPVIHYRYPEAEEKTVAEEEAPASICPGCGNLGQQSLQNLYDKDRTCATDSCTVIKYRNG